MTSNGFVVASCMSGIIANAPSDIMTARARIEVNDHVILSVAKEGLYGNSATVDATLCFPVKKGDTVFISASASISSGGYISGDVSATFFPCL